MAAVRACCGGPSPEFGLRLQVLARPTSAQAWADADLLALSRAESLIGSYDEVVETLSEYADLGVSRLELVWGTPDGPDHHFFSRLAGQGLMPQHDNGSQVGGGATTFVQSR